jgi:hypothetical protein
MRNLPTLPTSLTKQYWARDDGNRFASQRVLSGKKKLLETRYIASLIVFAPSWERLVPKTTND